MNTNDENIHKSALGDGIADGCTRTILEAGAYGTIALIAFAAAIHKLLKG